MPRARAVVLLALVPAAGVFAAPPDPAAFVAVTPGAVPVIVSAPHGGATAIPGVPARKGDGVKQFVTVRDTGTEELAADVVAAIERELGGKPFAVVARFPRTQADANRPPEAAYEDPAAKPVYDLYHATLAAHCRAVQKKWGRGLLIDLHGQAADKKVVFRGTRNGQTVKSLVERFGRQAVVGSDSVLGGLAARGYGVFPALGDRDAKEHPSYNGGHIVATYGSGNGTGIDAIQLELGGDHRAAAKRKDVAADLAAAVGRFARAYLPGDRE